MSDPRPVRHVFSGVLDLVGRAGPARLRLRVRFGEREVPTLVWPARAGRIYAAEVSRDPSVGYFGIRTVFRFGGEHQDRQNDVRHFRDFVDEQIDEIAIAGRNSAKGNRRDVIVAQDLPITKGVQERMREFDELDEAEEIRELLLTSQVVRHPPGDVTFAEDTDQLLPELFGGLSVALARSFRRTGRDNFQPVDRALGSGVHAISTGLLTFGRP